MFGDTGAVAMDVPHRRGEIGLVLATVEHQNVVAVGHELPDDARTDEDRSPNDEHATHCPILFHPPGVAIAWLAAERS